MVESDFISLSATLPTLVSTSFQFIMSKSRPLNFLIIYLRICGFQLRTGHFFTSHSESIHILRH